MGEKQVTKLGAEFGTLMAQKRAELGMNQGDLAETIGLSRSSVANLESGYFQVSAVNLFEIAIVLGISLDALKQSFKRSDFKTKRMLDFHKKRIQELEAELKKTAR